jgi:hypothetical protein
MTTAGAQRAILSSAGVTFFSVTFSEMAPSELGGKGNLPSPRILIGLGFTCTALSLLSGPAPEVAGGLAIAMAFTAATAYGIPLAEKYFTQPPPKSKEVK